MLYLQIRCKNNNISTAFTLFGWLKLVNYQNISESFTHLTKNSKPFLSFLVISVKKNAPNIFEQSHARKQ